MADRIKLLIQKRISLKSQMTNVNNLFEKGKLDNATLRLRINRLTELYYAYEKHNDELAVLDSDEKHQEEFLNIQERFYSLAGRVENLLSAACISDVETGTSNSETRSSSSDTVAPAKKRRIKLLEAPLPTFDVKYENWLPFKNAFQSMIGLQPDLADVDKLHYLKSALIDEAANKIRIFTIDGINYSSAWELLERL